MRSTPGQTDMINRVVAPSPVTPSPNTTAMFTMGTAIQIATSVRAKRPGRSRSRWNAAGPTRSAPPNITANVAVQTATLIKVTSIGDSGCKH